MTEPTCPDCGQPLPAHSPQALCPACLMRQALASRTIADDGDPKTALPPPAPGEIAAKFPQFEIAECLGRGGMGVVYKARQKSLDRWVAIKILAPERIGDPAFADRFASEARTLAQLNHPNIVTVYDHGETDGLFYIVMEYVDGVNLRDVLRDGKLPPRQALGIVPPVCEALQFAHDKGIVHRDIKPENLLLDREGRVKIADFGIATLMGATGSTAGTPPYMAPEQAAARETDHRADIHALGVVLYEMLTGERPGETFVTPSHKVSINPRIDELVMRAMAKDPSQRFRTAGEFGAMANTLVDSLHTAPPPLPLPPPKSMLRRWWWLFLVMVPMGVAFGLAAAGVFNYLLPKKYEAEATIEVRPASTNAPGLTPMFFGTEFEKIKSTKVLGQVSKDLDLPRRWMMREDGVVRVLKTLVTTQNVRGTDLMTIRVRHTNPEDAANIARALVYVYRAESRREVIPHDMPSTPKTPISPNLRLNLLLGSFVGLLISPLLALVLMLVLQKLVPERNKRIGSTSTRSIPAPA